MSQNRIRIYFELIILFNTKWKKIEKSGLKFYLQYRFILIDYLKCWCEKHSLKNTFLCNWLNGNILLSPSKTEGTKIHCDSQYKKLNERG